jgi:tellurite resistance protein TerC
VFAILGLRAMYFLLANMHEKFHLLSYGLALILGFIGTKMLMMGVYKIPVGWSLAVTAAILVSTMVLSLLLPPRTEPRHAGTSSLSTAPSTRLGAAARKTEERDAG